tara:strand:+ start:166 stop:366 length:201 start_codon:yes stop_codon:yes gene_type:complete
MQKRLEDLIKVFLADKVFVGCAGQEINDEIRVTIVAQACLLIINRTNNYYQNTLGTGLSLYFCRHP